MDVPTVTPAEVPDPLPQGVRVLDVREPDEWAAGHVEGATHIPLADLPGRLDEIPTQEQLVVMCKVGGRSARATTFLQTQGYPAVNLAGGIHAWVDAERSIVTDDGSPGTVA